MSRILFAWEIGDHSGHVVPYLPLLARYRNAGHEVVVAVRDTGEVGDRVHAAGLALAQAPVCLKAFAGLPEDSVHYPEILRHHGYAHEATLTGLALGWRTLFDTVRPDLVLANNSPLAIWTARERGVRRVRLGSGFNCPPLGDPMPALRPDAGATFDRRAASEAQVVRTLDAAGARTGLGATGGFAAIFAGCETWLFTYPELDHYGARAGERYLGLPDFDPIRTGSEREAPEIFAYLRRDHPHTERLLGVLARLDRPALVFCPDLDAAAEGRFTTAHLRITRTPVDARALLPQVKAVVSHAGHNLTAESLLCGVPVLALPGHLEQDLVAASLERLGAGIRIPFGERNPRLAQGLARLLDDSSYKQRATGFSRQWRDHPQHAPPPERISA